MTRHNTIEKLAGLSWGYRCKCIITGVIDSGVLCTCMAVQTYIIDT